MKNLFKSSERTIILSIPYSMNIVTSTGLALKDESSILTAYITNTNTNQEVEYDDSCFTWTRKEDPEYFQSVNAKSITVTKSDLVDGNATFICRFVADDINYSNIQSVIISESLNGWSTANLTLYKRSSTVPGGYDGDNITYTFGTRTIQGDTGTWSKTIPTGNDVLYAIYATAFSQTATDTIKYTEWTTPEPISLEGTEGDPGLSVGTVMIFQRSVSTPQTPQIECSYDFSTNKVVGISPWIQTIPSGNDPLWVSIATVVSNDLSDIILPSEWTEPIIYTKNGEDGIGIDSVKEYYAVSSSNSTAPTEWVDYPVSTTNENRYLWNYEEITYTDGSKSETAKRIIGTYGDTGNGISSITNYYLAYSSSSGVTISTSGWTTSIQSVSETKPYLWNYEQIQYTYGTSAITSPVVIGMYSKPGADAKLLALSADNTTFRLQSDGTPYPNQKATVSVRKQGIMEPTKWTVQNKTIADDTESIELEAGDLIDGTLTIRVTAGEYSDSLTLNSVKDGAPAIDPVLMDTDLASYTFPASSSGIISPSEYEKFKSTFNVSQSGELFSYVDSESSLVNKSFTMSATGDGITNLAVSDGAISATADSVMLHDSASISVSIKYIDAYGTEGTFSYKISLAKAKDGEAGVDGTDGADAQFVKLHSDGTAFFFDTDGNPVDNAPITVTVEKQNIKGTTHWDVPCVNIPDGTESYQFTPYDMGLGKEVLTNLVANAQFEGFIEDGITWSTFSDGSITVQDGTLIVDNASPPLTSINYINRICGLAIKPDKVSLFLNGIIWQAEYSDIVKDDATYLSVFLEMCYFDNNGMKKSRQYFSGITYTDISGRKTFYIPPASLPDDFVSFETSVLMVRYYNVSSPLSFKQKNCNIILNASTLLNYSYFASLSNADKAALLDKGLPYIPAGESFIVGGTAENLITIDTSDFVQNNYYLSGFDNNVQPIEGNSYYQIATIRYKEEVTENDFSDRYDVFAGFHPRGFKDANCSLYLYPNGNKIKSFFHMDSQPSYADGWGFGSSPYNSSRKYYMQGKQCLVIDMTTSGWYLALLLRGYTTDAEIQAWLDANVPFFEDTMEFPSYDTLPITVTVGDYSDTITIIKTLQLISVKDTVRGLQSSIEANAEQIKLKVSQSDYDTKVTELESSITQTADKIALVVKDGKVYPNGKEGNALFEIGTVDGQGYILLDAEKIIATGTITGDKIKAKSIKGSNIDTESLYSNDIILGNRLMAGAYAPDGQNPDRKAGFYADKDGRVAMVDAEIIGTIDSDALTTVNAIPNISSSVVKNEYAEYWDNAVCDERLTWTAISDMKVNIHLTSVCYGNGKFVAVGLNGGGSYSTDGITWTAISDMKFPTSINGIIYSVCYGNGKFVAVGLDGRGSYSTDGITWTAISDMKFGTDSINSVCYGNGKFVAVGGRSKGSYSTDGITWTAISDTKFGTSSSIYSICYGNGKFVAVGMYGNGSYSTDGITWTEISDMKFPAGYYDIQSICYGNGKFVAVGLDGRGSYSTDGITWTAISDMKFGTDSINSVCYGNGKFVAVGDSSKGSYSTDGITWTEISDMKFGGGGEFSNTIQSVCYGTDKFVAVGVSSKGSYSTDYDFLPIASFFSSIISKLDSSKVAIPSSEPLVSEKAVSGTFNYLDGSTKVLTSMMATASELLLVYDGGRILLNSDNPLTWELVVKNVVISSIDATVEIGDTYPKNENVNLGSEDKPFLNVIAINIKGNLTGNVNSQGTSNKVWGAVFN